MSKERPILVSGPLIGPILRGEKTVTRRLMLPEHAPIAVEPYDTPNVFMFHDDGTPLDKWYRFSPETTALLEHMRPAVSRSPWSNEVRRPTKARLRQTMRWQANNRRDQGRSTRDEVAGLCPFGIPGDVLWVRETWAHTTLLGNPITVYNAEDTRTDYGGPWKPSIHMKRADARIFLRVESVGVERVQDITEEDAQREGVTPWPYFGTSREAFAALWDSLAPVDSKWANNPWVWRIGFKLEVPNGR